MNKQSLNAASGSRRQMVPEAGVSWVVEQDGICLLPAPGVESRFLSYPQAAAWDLLVQGYSPERISQIIGILCGWSDEIAAEQVQDWIHGWKESGFIKDEIQYG
jgi:hypothetical protein